MQVPDATPDHHQPATQWRSELAAMKPHPHALPSDEHAKRTARLLRDAAAAIDLVLSGLLQAIRTTGPVPPDVTAAANEAGWLGPMFQALADHQQVQGDA